MSPTPKRRALLAAASLVLVATAALHASGYRQISAMVAESGIDPAWRSALPGLWIVFSIHLAVLAIILLVAARGAGRGLLLACALMPAADTLVLLRHVGIFVGSILLALVTVLVLVAAVTRPEPGAPPAA